MNKKLTLRSLLTCLSMVSSGLALADYTSSVSVSAAYGTIDSDQGHKDVDIDEFGLHGKYFLSEVPAFENALGASEFISKHAYLFVDLEQIDQTPKDDFKMVRAGFDGRVLDTEWRVRLGAMRSSHETELRDDGLSGGLIGFGYYTSEYGLLMLDYERLDGGGYEISDLRLNYSHLIDEPDLTFRVAMYFELEKRQTPYEGFRLGKGFKDNAWGGSVGFFVSPKLEIGASLRSMSIDYLSDNDGAFNALSGFTEHYYSERFSWGLEGTLSRQTIERSNGLSEVVETGAGFKVHATTRF
jgi:hypothetical protein